MKKGFLLGVVVMAGGFLSCQGHSKGETQVESKEYTEMTPNVVEEVPVYKVENGRIIPTNGRPTIVDFSATWCPPCKQLKPIFEKLADEFHGRINFITIDVDENPELSVSYGVQSRPMMVFLDKEGQIQDMLIGLQSREKILETINNYYGF